MLSQITVAILTIAFLINQAVAVVPGPCVTPFIYSYGTSCFRQCPWNVSLVTYLSATNTSCLTTCPNGTFADDSTKKCVFTCPSGPIRTYYDMTYNRCVDNCSTDPMQFAAPNYTCVTNCPSPTYGDQLLGTCVIDCPVGTYYMVFNLQRLCVEECYPNFYANPLGVCVAATSCPSAPVAFFGDDSTGICVQRCPVGRGTYADNSTRKCVIYCPLGSFADPTTQICVATCPSLPSLFGSNITRTCISQCNWGEYADITSRQCTRICPSGTYGDNSTRRCVSTCPSSQSTFADPLTRLCVRICPNNYYADTDSRLCVSGIDCSNNTYGDPVTQYCVEAKECSPGLYVDIVQGLCVLRCSTWGDPITGFCQPDCPDTHFQDPSTRLCVTVCPVNPPSFGNPLSRSCVGLCPVGYLADPSTQLCVQTCPQNFYANVDVRQCVANCTQNTTSILFFYKLTLSCVSNCPLGFFADNATLSCVTVCTNHTFGYPVTRQCVDACPDGWFVDGSSSMCVQSCPAYTGQYADPSTNYCVDVCPSNPDYYGQDLNDGNKTCVNACLIDGFFADPLTRTCVYICDQEKGYFGNPSDKRCYTRCPTGYGNPINAQCVSVCPRVPKFFYGDNLTGLCVLSCPSQTYGDPSSNRCVPALNCSSGLTGDDASGLCVATCSQLLNLYADPVIGKCVPVCTWPYYADPTDQKCTLSCKSSLFKDNSTLSCVSSCSSLPDTYGDPNSGFCEYNCTAGWFAYASGTLRICVSMCPSNPPMLADLQSRMCVFKCANQTYSFRNNSFRGCLYTCPPQVFNASLQIDLFADNTTWQCVVVCPYGFYAFKHPSDANIRQCVRDCPMVGSTYYYAEDTTRSCVTDCPLQYQETYGDKIDFRCKKTCSRNQYRDNSTATCVYRCPNGTFANNNTWNCSAWCDEGFFAENINNTCVKVCPKDLFGYQKVCIPQCPNNTMQYNDNSTWLCVNRCPSYPAYFADNSSVKCVLKCPSGTYADEYTRQCVLPINCTQPTMADPVSGRCVLQCTKDPMYYLTIEQNLCGSTCSNSTFAFNETNLCVDQCPQPYFGVNTTANFYCVQFCPANYYMWVNITVRICLPNCPEGLFADNLTWSCVQECPDYTYANNSNNMCIPSCFPLYADDFSKSCVEICPNGTTASNHSYKCQTFCDYGEYMLKKVCLSSCPNNLFADNLTRACVSNCPYDPLTFADPISNRCVLTCNTSEYAYLGNLTCATTCPLGFYKEISLKLCLVTCLQGFFSNNQTQTCVTSCVNSSYPYADPTSKACVQTCPKNPDLYGYGNECVTQCPPGLFAQNVTRTCVSVCPNVSSTYPNASWADTLTRRCLARCSSLSYSFSNSTNNTCLNTCPTNFYASIIDQACLAQCPPGSFAHNSSTTCVDQCPSGQWADLLLRICMPNCSHNGTLFADNSSASCVTTCPSYPDLFAQNTTHKCVLTCPPGSFAENSSRICLDKCPPPLFADSYQLQCVRTCLNPQIPFADNVTRTCESACVNHTINGSWVIFYQDNSTLSCVSQCPLRPNKLYGDNATHTCVQTCPNGTFGDNDTRVCLDTCVFQAPKFTWKDRLNNFCVTLCPYGYFADNSTGACQLNCSNGTFADASSRRCVVNCPNNPTSYSTRVAGVGVCVYNCPNGTFSSEVSISCVATCPTSPVVYYTYPPTNACVKECIFPYYADLSLQACVDSCKVGFYGNLTLKSCQPCQIECVTCTGYLVCTSCIAGFYLFKFTCVVTCPTYPVLYYASKQTGVCNLTCQSPFFGQPATGLCQLTCAALEYPNTVTRICTPCPIGCRLCNAIGCSSCLTGFTFLRSALACNQNCNATHRFYFNNSCFAVCPSGSYLTYDLVRCSACSAPCATCIGTAGNCTSCIGSYFYLGKCLDACPNNFYIDDRLNCVACSANPQRCTLPPLTYKITTFTANYRLQAYCVFSRPVNLTIAQFTSIVQIRLNGQPLKSNQFTPSVHNSTTFLVRFSSDVSLNQMALSFYFPPGSISDQYGNSLTTVTVQQNVTMVVSVNADVAKTSQSVQDFAEVIAIAVLILIVLLLFKSSYVGLIALQAMQLIHLHIFLFWAPLPYLQNKFLYALKCFNFLFIPSLLTPLNITNNYYSSFTNDVSFNGNSPIIVMFIIAIGVYALVTFLSNKNFVSNKSLRKTCKKIRKNRVKYGLLLDVCWAVYPFAILIALLQFKMATMSNTSTTINMTLSGFTFIVLNCVAGYLLYLAYKYNKNPEKVPKKFNFMMIEPSNILLQMPIRYLRKFFFVIALLLPSIQSQLVLLLSINISFFIMLLIYHPSKNAISHYACVCLQLLLIILECLCFAYDKLDVKSIDNQMGFATGMIVIEFASILIVTAWVGYRLLLVIKDSDIWARIYAKLTQNTDHEYLKEQQRKRDLEFDFEGLDAPSQDAQTDNGLQKMPVKQQSLDQKFNIFDQEQHQESFNLEKPFKVNQPVRSRPASIDSSEKILVKSNSSEAKGPFEPSRTGYRRKNHLQIRNRQMDHQVQQVMLGSELNQSGVEIVVKQQKKKQKGVLWEDIDIDDDEY